MRIFGRLRAAAAVSIAAFGVTCSKDPSTSVVVPQTVAATSGDNQSAFTGDSLINPLVARVTGSNSQPLRDVAVTWTVTGGTATVGPTTTVTDSQGLASATVALGATPGLVNVQAAVTGLPPAQFLVRACDHPAIALGDSVNGALVTTDCRIGSWYTDFYELAVPSGPQGVTLTETAGTFDTYLELYQAAGTLFGFADDIDTLNKNSRLTAMVGAGNYIIAPSSFDTGFVGAYSLSAVASQVQLAGCQVLWVTRGAVVSDSLTSTDCVDTTGGPHYADVVGLQLVAGSVLTVSQQSTAFDAALFLHTGGGTAVASNNDSSAGVQNAYLVYPVATTGTYVLFAASHAAGATGPYTLSISAATTLTGSSRREEGPQLLRMGGLRLPKGRSPRAWSRAGR